MDCPKLFWFFLLKITVIERSVELRVQKYHFITMKRHEDEKKKERGRRKCAI
jgi:hypothetical protein